MPFSTIFHLYRGSQFYWWLKLGANWLIKYTKNVKKKKSIVSISFSWGLSWSYGGSWIDNYLCNQCLSPLLGLWCNAIFNNISFISWQSVLLVVETRSTRRKLQTCRKSLTSFSHGGCRDRMVVVELITTYAISVYHHYCCEF
jgi:hypothetical protein